MEQLYAIADQGFRELEQVRLSPIVRQSASSDSRKGCQHIRDYNPASREPLTFVARRACPGHQRI